MKIETLFKFLHGIDSIENEYFIAYPEELFRFMNFVEGETLTIKTIYKLIKFSEKAGLIKTRKIGRIRDLSLTESGEQFLIMIHNLLLAGGDNMNLKSLVSVMYVLSQRPMTMRDIRKAIPEAIGTAISSRTIITVIDALWLAGYVSINYEGNRQMIKLTNRGIEFRDLLIDLGKAGGYL